ncbi:tannase/feruloyl esterase family alpha/beta hydrolase [Pseudomonas canadensis]|uniref:tannase/feruloyl esterase family alpha/beta hydrolase n=1 Tax=Pseudomonas canadensis TaxID=915099 RepID=UPI002B2539DE|nr:tannase/feruloyl esterase family alpha/beta hydrolase [Pseudomonas canadensis]MEB2647838.1 tannase/feruloyl esterase family alpha/beta hydrolase [Pseudomonas canadensis]
MNILNRLPVILTLAVVGSAQAMDHSAEANCNSLSSVALQDTVVEKSVLVEAGPMPDSEASLPAHCLVRGTIESRVGNSGVAFGSKFELRLPVSWNGRFMFQGGSGTDGVVLPAYGERNQPKGNTPALAQGFAIVTTDGGHEDKDSSFGLDAKARTDWGYHSIDIVTQAAKMLLKAYYGRAQDYSYFVGCSNGGRQAMMMSQRFPDYFDGIVAGDPVFRLSASHIASMWDVNTFTAIAPKNADGKPVLSKAFSDSDLTLLSQSILQQCDALDGLRDGLVSNPAACHFNPRPLQCKGEKNDQCLSAAQISAMESSIAGPSDSKGNTLYSRWAWDPALSSEGWRTWKLGTSITEIPNAKKAGSSINAIRYVFVTPPAPELKAAAFDFDKDPQRMKASASFADASSTDLSAFRRHGGKIIFYHGMADPAISALDTQTYYQQLSKAQGGEQATQQFARFFQVPGMTHCNGGNGLDSFDTVSAITSWVEKGHAPDQLLATGQAMPGVSRPLCPFPSTARYSGTGDPNVAKNFSCR